MSDDLNQEPEQNPENVDFAESEVNLNDDPAVQEAMQELPEPLYMSKLGRTFAHLDNPATQTFSTEANDQPQPPDENKKSGESVWGKIRQIFLGSEEHIAERIRHLDEAIENAADTPANYVLRGELYLSAREYALARRDFQRAYELAAAQFEHSDWGLMAQAMQDRALVGLQQAEKRLQTNGE